MSTLGKGYVDPRDFGAVGDGVADDTAAWQATIEHAALSGLPILAVNMRLNVATERLTIPAALEGQEAPQPKEQTVAHDGDDYPDGEFFCTCGRGPYRLHWNGGELDNVRCECGLWYYGRHERVALRVDRRGPYDLDPEESPE